MMNVPPSLGEVDGTELSAVYRFITEIAVKLVGKRALKKWMRDNKGKSALDMITMSDVAYCLTLIENNKEKWDQAYMISTLSPEEQKKWKDNKTLSADERTSYTKKEPLFTSRRGNKSSYKKSGLNEDGVAFYRKHFEAWKTLARDSTSWDMLQEGWSEFNSDTGWSEQWVANEISGEERRREEEELMEVDADAFALPGDESFENDRAGQVIVPPLPALTPHKTAGKKRSRSAEEIMLGLGESSSESESESEEEEDSDDEDIQRKRGRMSD